MRGVGGVGGGVDSEIIKPLLWNVAFSSLNSRENVHPGQVEEQGKEGIAGEDFRGAAARRTPPDSSFCSLSLSQDWGPSVVGISSLTGLQEPRQLPWELLNDFHKCIFPILIEKDDGKPCK